MSTYESNADIMVKLLEKEIGKGAFDIYEYVTMCTLDIIYGKHIFVRKYIYFRYSKFLQFSRLYMHLIFIDTGGYTNG